MESRLAEIERRLYEIERITKRPYTPEQLRQYMKDDAEKCYRGTNKQIKLLEEKLSDITHKYAGQVAEYLLGSEDSDKWDRRLVVAIINWMELNNRWEVNGYSWQELDKIVEFLSNNESEAREDGWYDDWVPLSPDEDWGDRL